MKNTALIVVDMLYDFINGSMACHEADKAVENTVRFIEKDHPSPILFVRDHHPTNHCSFTAQGGPWPPHCVQGTHGADIHEALVHYADEDLSFFKGENPDQEQYSGFEGRNPAGQSLSEVLHLLEMDQVLICGIATEYCVRNTAEDLLKDGFRVSILQDSIAYVDAQGHEDALKAMKEEGIALI